MQKNLIAAAIATMGISSAAFALPPSALPADIVVYAGGGSAQAQAVIYLGDQLLSNVDSYTDGGCNGKQSGNYRIFFGTLKSAQGGNATAGAKVLLYYKFNGGSFPNGIQPQGKGTTLPYPSNSTGASSAVGTAAACAGQSWPLPSYNLGNTTTDAAIPDWGIADEEVTLLNNLYNVPSAAASNLLSKTQVANIATQGIYDNIFGVAVSNNVFTAGTANGSCAKTNFTRLEMQGVLSGAISDWSQLQGDGGCSIAAGPIVLLDRGAGSGSKASGNLYFLGYPNNGYTQPNSIAVGYTTYNGTRVACNGSYEDVNEGSSGNVVADLQAANNHNGGADCRAVAVLGGEFPPALNGGGYSFTAINGVAIDSNINGTGTVAYANVINGAYDYAFTNSFNNRAKTTFNTHCVGTGCDATYSGLIQAAQKIFKQPTLPGGAQPHDGVFSPSGTLLDPNNSAAFGSCMARWTRFDLSQAPLQFYYDFSNALPTCADAVSN